MDPSSLIAVLIIALSPNAQPGRTPAITDTGSVPAAQICTAQAAAAVAPARRAP